MLSLLKKLFGKPEPKAVTPTERPVVSAPSSLIPTIEVLHLSLAAIVARFPDELKPLVGSQPDPAATVALPVPTILKQLPVGTVKMSLASLHRQAHGIIKPLPAGDKRSVEIPLAEIFRHFRLDLLRRRDQRRIELPETGFNLFGDAANPYAIAPDAAPEEPPPRVLELTPDEVPNVTPEAPRVLKMDDALKAHYANGTAAEPATATAPPTATDGRPLILAPPPEQQPPKPSGAIPPARPSGIAFAAPASTPAPAPVKPEPVVTKPEGPTLVLPVASLAANWPDEIRVEVDALAPGTKVTLPASDVAAGLSKGRVTFSWRQIRAWLEPESFASTAVSGDTALTLPLKVVAPAFLASSKKPAAGRRTLDFDQSIPALFTGGNPPPEAPAAPAPPTAAAEPEPAPEPEAPAPPPAPKLPETVAEIFNQPPKETWTPAEIVAGTVTLPGVSGAVVALQEGLVVSSSLPEGVKSEVVAAFLPQIFARLNQYSGEMRLGEVDDLLFTTHGAHCQIYRLGYIYFAVLGKAGEPLPWHELRLITEELARQTHK